MKLYKRAKMLNGSRQFQHGAINLWVVEVEPTDHIEWCFTCGHRPYTDGLGYEHRKDSGCHGSGHEIAAVVRVPKEDGE